MRSTLVQINQSQNKKWREGNNVLFNYHFLIIAFKQSYIILLFYKLIMYEYFNISFMSKKTIIFLAFKYLVIEFLDPNQIVFGFIISLKTAFKIVGSVNNDH